MSLPAFRANANGPDPSPPTTPSFGVDRGNSLDCGAFVAEAAPKLRRVFAVRYGIDAADDIAAEALEYAWANWSHVSVLDNPIGFLYSVGCSKSRRYARWRRRINFPVEPVRAIESRRDLFDGLRQLSDDQRVAVVAVHGYGWTYREVAEILNATESAVTNHVHRGLVKLRALMGES
jgi:RNA polymerase sigma factor (sigma-70 family)